MMQSNKREYDIIIFGATSFTGKWLVHEVLKAQDNGDKFTWAISGRSTKKMEELLTEVSKETGKNLTKVDKIQADVYNPSTLEAMAHKCQVVLNLVGPYTQWGEAVVKACVEAGTHHLDLSGEPQFLGKMELKYSKIAEESGAYIIGACGFDSIPSDCGVSYLQKNFNGEVNSIETFVKMGGKGRPRSSAIHYGTYHSLVLVMHHLRELYPLRRALYNNSFPPKPDHKLPLFPIQYCKEVNSWALAVPFPDGDVLDRSQRYAFQNENKKPIQTRVYFQMPVLAALVTCIWAFCIGLLAQFKFGVRLLENHPKFFTFGMCSHEGPSKEDMNKVRFTFTLVAKGWSKKKDKHDEPPNQVKILKVQGTNPGYGATVTMFLQSALTILAERNRMPARGGVYTPSVAFAKTSLIDRLNRNGVLFSFQK